MWISGDGGPALASEECSLYGVPNGSAFSPACNRYRDVGGTYTYTMNLGPAPAAGSRIVVDPVEVHPETDAALRSVPVTVTTDPAAGTATVSFTLPHGTPPERYGISVFAGWSKAPRAVAHVVTLKSITVNATLDGPVPAAELHDLAAELGADVPFFLVDGPRLGSGDGATLAPLDLPQDFWIVLALPNGVRKESTESVYAAFDGREGERGWEERRAALFDALETVRRPRDLAGLPPNDLASSPVSDELRALGAFRADVSGAGPTVYGLFHHRRAAQAAQRALKRVARTWLTAPAWYG